MTSALQPDQSAVGAVRHSGQRVYCAGHASPATISVVERLDTQPALRFVLWCSLRDIGQCDERCLPARRRVAERGDAP